MKKLRSNIRVLMLAVLVLFGILGGYFGYSVYFYGGRWFSSSSNIRIPAQKAVVVPGTISDRTGLVLAEVNAEGSRSYPTHTAVRRAVSHVVGDSRGIVSNGAETFFASYLLGFRSGVGERFRLLLSGEQAQGDNISLTIDAKLCEYAADRLDGYRAGAVVLLNYKTGEILCSTSYPNFDTRHINETLSSSNDNGALVNRVTQGLYPPGSTFKIITLASALENLAAVESRTFNCTGAVIVNATTVTEASNAVHGIQDLSTAFANSCNTTFASLALELGYSRLSRTASNFGFGDNFLFQDLVVYNSQFPTSKRSEDDLAWAGIGQGRVLVTPLHMAMIAGAIANDGVMMEPRLLLNAVSPDGQTRAVSARRSYTRVTAESIARTIGEYMTACVQRGTGKKAQISGLTVAGKTGSAETSDDKSVKTHAWFVGYITDDAHPLAIAVLVERGGGGGSVAAPIAQRVLKKAVELGY